MMMFVQAIRREIPVSPGRVDSFLHGGFGEDAGAGFV